MNFYPTCPDEGETIFLIQTVLHHLEENPKYLDDPECPYATELRNLFKSLAPKTSLEDRIDEVNEADPDEDRWKFLDREVAMLFNDLKTQSTGLGTSTSAEKMSYFRTATSLLEKLVSLQERTVGLKRIAEFHNTVMQVMDDVLTPDQRTTVMAKLGNVVNG